MDDLFSLFEKPKNPLSFNALRISKSENRSSIASTSC